MMPRPDRAQPSAVTVLVVDDHPALRSGLQGLLEQEHGLIPLGAVADLEGLHDALSARTPDVVILDYALADGDGLTTCFALKQRPDPPGVVMYSAYADAQFAVPATLAQADALVRKSAPVEDLLSAVRRAAAGEPSMPALAPEAMQAASARLAEDDLPVAGMLFARVSVPEIAETLGLRDAEVRARALRMIGELQARDRAGAPPDAALSGAGETRRPAGRSAG